VLSTSENKRTDAMKLGAHEFAVTKNADDVRRLQNRFDLILNTISAEHDYNLYLNFLKRDGTMVLLGLPDAQPLAAFSLVPRRKNLSGSMIGGIAETQEMLDFCAEHGITPEIEMIKMSQINEAFQRLLRNDVHYRFVIDMATL
jgi:alcohol dehydrogenase (NADP+)